MPLEDFIIHVYCLIDDWLKKPLVILRHRGFSPTFSDAEVLTLEVVAEFMGYEQDKQAWEYFRRHWLEWFPKLPSRSTYVRQAAHLWQVKQQLHADLCWAMGVMENGVHRVDGFPLKLCNFRRANEPLPFVRGIGGLRLLCVQRPALLWFSGRLVGERLWRGHGHQRNGGQP